MLSQLIIGSSLIFISIVIEVSFIQIAIKKMSSMSHSRFLKADSIGLTVTLSCVTFWLLTAMGIAVAVWGTAFLLLDCFSSFEKAVYFSMVSITTLGYGDITLPKDWRLLSGFIAANGLVLFGLNTAFLIETLRSILNAEDN